MNDTLFVRVTPALKALVQAVADRRMQSMSDTVRQALLAYFAEEEDEHDMEQGRGSEADAQVGGKVAPDGGDGAG